MTEELHTEDGVTITVTRSDGDDGAVLILIDTDFEPDASDGGPGLRVLLNDTTAYAGVAYQPPRGRWMIASDVDDEALWWSNDDGWVDQSNATVFSNDERRTLWLPEGLHVHWVEITD